MNNPTTAPPMIPPVSKGFLPNAMLNMIPMMIPAMTITISRYTILKSIFSPIIYEYGSGWTTNAITSAQTPVAIIIPQA